VEEDKKKMRGRKPLPATTLEIQDQLNWPLKLMRSEYSSKAPYTRKSFTKVLQDIKNILKTMRVNSATITVDLDWKASDRDENAKICLSDGSAGVSLWFNWSPDREHIPAKDWVMASDSWTICRRARYF
jgi:hypothetical protein